MTAPDLAIMTPEGELLGLSTATPVTVDEAAVLLPRVREALQAVRRYADYLEDMVRRSMVERGQRERRSGDTLYELKAEAEWIIDRADALADLLQAAVDSGDITADERAKAHQVVVSHRWNHTHLNTLAKRVPEVDQYRRRTEGEPRLRIK